MKKQIIRITENDLHSIIRNSVLQALNERHVLKLHGDNGGADMPPMDMGADPTSSMPPSGDDMPPMNEPPMPMDNQGQDMGGQMPPMNNPMPQQSSGDGSEISNMFNTLNPQDQNAARNYIKSMIDDSNNNGIDDGMEIGGDDPSMGGNQTMPQQPNQQMPMESRRYNLDEIITDILERDKPRKRKNKEISQDIPDSNPFRSQR